MINLRARFHLHTDIAGADSDVETPGKLDFLIGTDSNVRTVGNPSYFPVLTHGVPHMAVRSHVFVTSYL